MNALGKDLTNTVVVLHKDLFPPAYQMLPYRLFRVIGGNGARPDTLGRKIFGEHMLAPGRHPMGEGDTQAMYYGFEVERMATTKDMQALAHIRQAAQGATVAETGEERDR